MATKSTNILIGLLGTTAGALLALGCANSEAGQEDGTAQGSEALSAGSGKPASSADTVAATRTVKPTATPRGVSSYVVNRSLPVDSGMFRNVYTVDQGSTFSASTSNGDPSNTDTVLVVYQRSDNARDDTWPYGNQINIKTLTVNDDKGDGTYFSSVSWTNNTGTSANVWLRCFAYCNGPANDSNYYCRPGTADLTVNGSYVGRVNCTSAIYPPDSQGGRAYLRSSIDSQLFVFNASPGNDGFINDDCGESSLQNPSNNLDACVSGLTSNSTWKGVSAYSGGSGNVTLDYPGY
jgi:hypothetical protein